MLKVEDSKSSGYSSEENSSLCDVEKRRVPSKSVRAKKKEQHKIHLNKKVVAGLNQRLDKKRLISDDDLFFVLEECEQIAHDESDHSDECSYFMNCRGEPCRCKPTIDEAVIPVVEIDERPELVDVEVLPTGRFRAAHESCILVRTGTSHVAGFANENAPNHLMLTDEIQLLCEMTEVCFYMKTIFAKDRIGRATASEVSRAVEISESFPYIPQPIGNLIRTVGLYSRENKIYVPNFNVTFHDEKLIRRIFNSRDQEFRPSEENGNTTTLPFGEKRYDLVRLKDWYSRYLLWWHDYQPNAFEKLCLSAYSQYRNSGPLGVMKETPRM